MSDRTWLEWLAQQTGLSEESDQDEGLAKASGIAHNIPFLDRVGARIDALNRREESDTGSRPADVFRGMVTAGERALDGDIAGATGESARTFTQDYLPAVGNFASNLLGAVSGDEGYEQSVERNLRRRQGETNRLASEHPVATGVGAATGALPLMAIPGVGQTNMYRNAGTLGRIGLTGAEAALMSGVQGAGNSQGESVGDVLADGANSAAWGAGIGGGLSALGQGAGALGRGLRNRAARNTLEQANIDPTRMLGAGDKEIAATADEVRRRIRGQTWRPAWMAGRERAGQAASTLTDDAGPEIGRIIDRMDDAYQRSRQVRVPGALPSEAASSAPGARQIVERFASPDDVSMLTEDAVDALGATAPRGRAAANLATTNPGGRRALRQTADAADTLVDRQAALAPATPPPLPRMAPPPTQPSQGVYRRAAWPAAEVSPGVGPSGAEVASRISDRVQENVSGLAGPSVNARRHASGLVQRYRDQLGDAAGNLSPRQLHRMRQEMDDLAGNWARNNATFRQEAMRQGRRETQSILDEIAEQALGSEGSQQYQNARRAYQAGALARDGTDRLMRRDANNRLFSLTDNLVASGALAASANPLEAVTAGFGAGLGNKFLRGRERGIASALQRGIARGTDVATLPSRGNLPRGLAGLAAITPPSEPAPAPEPIPEEQMQRAAALFEPPQDAETQEQSPAPAPQAPRQPARLNDDIDEDQRRKLNALFGGN